MSARDQILTYDEDNRENLADLLDAYAHELAEKIRAGRGTTSLENGHHFFSGMAYAADLIDPKAQRASIEGDSP